MLFFVCLPFSAQAQSSSMYVEDIIISGNQRIENSTILTYLGISEGDMADGESINRGLKKLYETGFFADVRITTDGDDLMVTVIENPSINRVAYEGNDAIDDEDLEAETTLRSRSTFTRTAVQRDVERLLNVYRRNGYYSATIEPQIIQREQNRVDLAFDITEGEKTSIRNISFIGNEAFSTADLSRVISSTEYAWYKLLSSDDNYDPDRLEYDKELLRRFYRAEGYADFNVTSAFAELTPQRDAFLLTFTLDEGDRYTLNKVDVENDLDRDLIPNLDELLLTKAGDRYDASAVENSIDAIIEELGDKGYAFVEIEPSLERDTQADTIDLTYVIKQGPRVYVERIDIIGNISTLDEVVRRELRFVEGDAYSTTKLRRSEQRLKNLGFFETVNVTTDPGSTPDRTIITVDVKEQSTGEISLGAGYSSTDGALADVGITERNLLGRGQTLRFRVLAAARRQQFDIGFTEPYLFNRELSGGVDLYKITQDFRTEASFERAALGGKLRAGYSFSEYLTQQLYYSIEQNEISDVDPFASRFIKDQEGENITSLVGHTLTYDRRDNRFAPTDGLLLRLTQDVAGVGGDDHFLRNEVQSEYYIPLAKQWTLAFAGSAGHIFGFGEDVRINQRFFVGGRELRGFEDAGIGPRDDTTDDSLGGNVYYTASSELQFPLGLPDDLGFTGALFIDTGSLWDSEDSGPEVVGNDHLLRASAGVGVTWASPFGPIRIDLAKPFLSEDYDIEETFRFSFGTRF
ncbi:MAG: outer membrane protein assembly factor BamA [Rickettsiales bacterium]|nr:outer membrane protein assembly factor BamA [Rickettsiales bacterium]